MNQRPGAQAYSMMIRCDLHAKLKAYAALRNMPMAYVIEELIEKNIHLIVTEEKNPK